MNRKEKFMIGGLGCGKERGKMRRLEGIGLKDVLENLRLRRILTNSTQNLKLKNITIQNKKMQAS
jgi:hypothetical protein